MTPYRMLHSALLTILLSGTLSLSIQANEPDKALVQKLKPQVVNIAIKRSQPLGLDTPGSWVGTGFVVDARRGIIATNQHISGISPAQYTVSFFNGYSTSQVQLLHYDAWHDFAFLQVDVASLKFGLEETQLGDSQRLQELNDVFLIGNNGAQEYSVLYGQVINTHVDAGDRHSATFQVIYGNRGGSSGSPIYDLKGQVVGIHYKGDGNTGFELRVEYLKDALEYAQEVADQLAQGNPKPHCRRGDLGCQLVLVKLSIAEKNLFLPGGAAERIRSTGEGIKAALMVNDTIWGSPARDNLAPGDIIVSIDGKAPGNDLYAFDKTVDARVGQKVAVEALRNGRTLNLDLEVRDAEEGKIRRFVQFAGGTLHELPQEIRRRYNIEGTGVFLSHTKPGSTLSEVGDGTNDQPDSRFVLIQAVNGSPTPNLDAFIELVSAFKNGQDINITRRDYNKMGAPLRVETLTISLQFEPLKLYELGLDGRWLEKPLPTKAARGQ